MELEKSMLKMFAPIMGVAIFAAMIQTMQPTLEEPGVLYCPYCGAGPFATVDELNEHIATDHPGQLPPTGLFTVRIINYEEILENAAETGLVAQWYTEIPSTLLVEGWPIRYLMPSDGRNWRLLSEDCPFLVPEGSEYWNPHPYLSIWIIAGPACSGHGWADENCRSYGVTLASGPTIEINPGCVVIYDYAGGKLTVEE